MACSVDECDRVHYGRGYCKLHYDRWKKHGDPLWERPSVEERFWAKVEKTDGCWLWTAHTLKGYGMFNAYGVGRSPVYAHRLSYEWANGPIPKGLEIDHRPTCDKRCVRPEHLRIATRKQQGENLAGALKTSTTGVRGVSPSGTKFKAQVKHHGKQMNLGRYATIEEAEAVVIAKRLELFTHNDLDRGLWMTTRPACTCGRTDDWHRPSCASLSAAVLTARVDGTHHVYQNLERAA